MQQKRKERKEEKKKKRCVQKTLNIRARVVQNIQRFSWLQTKQKDLVYVIFGRVAGVWQS